MFTVYALNLTTGIDTEIEAATLDQALMHIRELVIGDLNDPGGPVFDRYGLSFDRSKDGPESLPFKLE